MGPKTQVRTVSIGPEGDSELLLWADTESSSSAGLWSSSDAEGMSREGAAVFVVGLGWRARFASGTAVTFRPYSTVNYANELWHKPVEHLHVPA